MRFTISIFLISGLLLFFLNCGARWKAKQFSPDDRDEWQQPERVVGDLGLRAGQRIADVGAGGGYFTFRLSKAVGPSGQVIAVDLDADMLELIKEEATRRGIDNIVLQKGQADDPRIPTPVDLVFLTNTYHHIENPAAYFRNIRQYLKPGGRVAILDFHKEGFFHDFLGHGAEANQVKVELEKAGFRLARKFEYLSNQHFQIFQIVKE